MSDEILKSSKDSTNKKGDRPQSESSIQPYVAVKVPHGANRDEIVGAVDRALSTKELPFLGGPSAPLSTASTVAPVAGVAEAIKASESMKETQLSSPSLPHTVTATAPVGSASPADSSGGDNLVIVVQKEGW